MHNLLLTIQNNVQINTTIYVSVTLYSIECTQIITHSLSIMFSGGNQIGYLILKTVFAHFCYIFNVGME
jgi:hypothetical protein